jgi:hypothetical protein
MKDDKEQTEGGSNNKAAVYGNIAGGAVGIIVGSVILIWLLRKILKK